MTPSHQAGCISLGDFASRRCKPASQGVQASILARRNRMHDPAAPVVDRDAGERPRQGGADDATDDRAGWIMRCRDVCGGDEADNGRAFRRGRGGWRCVGRKRELLAPLNPLTPLGSSMRDGAAHDARLAAPFAPWPLDVPQRDGDQDRSGMAACSIMYSTAVR